MSHEKTKNMYYILSGHDVVPIGSVELWGQWFEQADRRVAFDQIGDIEISTVFLGMDHSFYDVGPIQVFETMIFRNGDGRETWRYATWEEAEAGHARAVASLDGSVL